MAVNSKDTVPPWGEWLVLPRRKWVISLRP